MDYTDKQLRALYPGIDGLERRTPRAGDRVEYRTVPGEIPPGDLGTVRAVAPDSGPLWVQFDNGSYVSKNAQRFSPLTERGSGVIKTDGTDREPGNVPEFTFTVSVSERQTAGDWNADAVLTGSEIAAAMRQASMEIGLTDNHRPDFSGEWHRVHPTGAIVSYAFWQGGNPYTLGNYPAEGGARRGVPGGAYRPWLDSSQDLP